eukprot:5879965-Amphidinium_carterae.1
MGIRWTGFCFSRKTRVANPSCAQKRSCKSIQLANSARVQTTVLQPFWCSPPLCERCGATCSACACCSFSAALISASTLGGHSCSYQGDSHEYIRPVLSDLVCCTRALL